MPWNWELPEWPLFICNLDRIAAQEKEFLLTTARTGSLVKKIEGQTPPLPSRVSKILPRAYETFDKPLTHEMLWEWHSELFKGRVPIVDCGKYRDGYAQIVTSSLYDIPIVSFEAPPNIKVPDEMDSFIDWFNSTRKSGGVLGRAAIAWVYFLNIHPFGDGNGRISRALVEKTLSQGIGRPLGFAVAEMMERCKEECCLALKPCNRSLNAQHLVEFFANKVVDAISAEL